MRCPRRHRSLMVALAGAAFLCAGAKARGAAPTADDEALATILFQEGRTLFAAGQLREACLKFEESERLDPGGGTLLNLALCHEQEGRLARSWSEFKQAESVARADGRADREAEAAKHVQALEPRLSRLTIVVPVATQVEGLIIERDGREVGRGAWSTAIPIDGGEHSVRATALGREPFSTTFIAQAESDVRTIEIPVLATPVVVVTSPRVSSPQLPAPPVAPLLTPPRLRHVGIAAAGAGVVLLGAAGYALATALHARDASNPNCYPDGCNEIGLRQRRDAVSDGNLATILGIGGSVLLVAGATSFYLGHHTTGPSKEARVLPRFTLAPSPGVLVAGIGGGF